MDKLPPPPFETEEFLANMDRYQTQWGLWRKECYHNPDVVGSIEDNRRRFAEESAELLQATGMTEAEAIFMVRWVYSRAKGEPKQEAAGAFNTLITLCNAMNIDLGVAAVEDLLYCWEHIGKIRDKQATKPIYQPPVAMPEWNDTNIQKALIMASGTPKQQQEAREFFKHHLIL